MLSTEKMRKVSIIIHQRRLKKLLGKLGEVGLIHLIKKEAKITSPTQLNEIIIQQIDLIQELLGKLGGIIQYVPEMPSEIPFKKFKLEGITVDDILDYISSDIEETYEKKNEIEDQINDLKSELANLMKIKRLWKDLLNLNVDFSRLKGLKNIVLVRVGYINTKYTELFRKSLDKFPHLFYEKEIDEEYSIFLLTSLQKYKDDIKRIEAEYHTTIIENVAEIRLEEYQEKVAKIEKIQSLKQKLNQELLEFLSENFNKLLAYKEVLTSLSTILKTESFLEHTVHFVTIEGWIPVSNLDFFIKFCNEITENTALIFVSKKFDPESPPPSKFNNKGIARAFETITRLYGYPNYKELDPTLILAISFPFIFGLMFGDIGHGLMLFLGGGFFYYRKRKEQGTWKNLTVILMLCGIFAMIAGFLYGECFGQHEIFGWHLHPILFNPISDMMAGLKFSVIVGTIMLSLGFLIEAINFVLQKRKIDAALIALPKIMIVCGGVYMVFEYGFQIEAWFQGPIFILIIPALILIFGKMFVHTISFSKILPSEKATGLIGEGLFEGWETFISFISNLPSFCRIFALSLVHIGLTGAIILLSDIAGNIILGTIILIFGHVAVVLFEILLVFVHSLRLHFHEFFGKFYAGDGKQYTPFYLSTQYHVLEFHITPENNEPQVA